MQKLLFVLIFQQKFHFSKILLVIVLYLSKWKYDQMGQSIPEWTKSIFQSLPHNLLSPLLNTLSQICLSQTLLHINPILFFQSFLATGILFLLNFFFLLFFISNFTVTLDCFDVFLLFHFFFFFFGFLFKIEIQWSQGWTATIRHGVRRKRIK